MAYFGQYLAFCRRPAFVDSRMPRRSKTLNSKTLNFKTLNFKTLKLRYGATSLKGALRSASRLNSK